MKKVIKWSAILGVIFCLAGIGVITAGAMMGGADEMGSYIYRIGGYHVPYVEPPVRITEDFGSGTVPEDDRIMDSISYEHVRELKIEAGPGEVMIVTEDREDPQDTSIRIEGYGVDSVLTWPYEIRMEDDELDIERSYEFKNIVGPFKDRRDDYKTKRMETLVIYIPRDYRFREVEIEAAAASVSVDEIRTDKLGLELMAGTLTIDNGSVGELDAECQAGTMNLTLEGQKTQFDYELSSSVGSIVLADGEEERYEGLHQEKRINNHAGKKAELECDAGELYIQFTDPEM